ncbi:hypothetical protein ACH5RR_029697 [Cinchona calisaya]|uniref:Uncharacterized protein n=1 Tax=Cinchona calisaya TaxID=153742 RepID=A0ABD2YUP7_9GENT
MPLAEDKQEVDDNHQPQDMAPPAKTKQVEEPHIPRVEEIVSTAPQNLAAQFSVPLVEQAHITVQVEEPPVRESKPSLPRMAKMVELFPPKRGLQNSNSLIEGIEQTTLVEILLVPLDSVCMLTNSNVNPIPTTQPSTSYLQISDNKSMDDLDTPHSRIL